MLIIVRRLARLIGNAGRALWNGAPTTRAAVIAGLVLLVILTTRAGLSGASGLSAGALVLAFLVVIYSLIIRGR